MSVVYEVNLDVHKSVEEAYKLWLKQHIAEILSLEGFLRAETFVRLVDEPRPDHFYLTVQYFLDSHDHLNAYFEKHAPTMRKDGMDRFGGKFTASRRILQKTDL